jgi:hypothetical protein
MAIIYSYPKVTSPLATDVLVLTDTTLTAGKRKNKTKSLALSDLAAYVVSSTSGITGGGTFNTIPLWTPDGFKLGDSIITQAASGQGVTITGQLDVTEDFNVTGSTELFGSLTVEGVATFNDEVECNNNVTVQGVFAADGNSVFSGSLTIDEQLIDGTGGSGTAGQVLSSTGTGVEWISDAGGSVTGTGTTNFVSKWLDSDTIQDSIIFDNGTNVGIGVSGINPENKLHVMGTVRSVIDTGSGFGFLLKQTRPGSACGLRWDSNNSSLTLKDSTDVITTKISSSGFSWFDGGAVGFGTKTPAAPIEMVVSDASGKGLLLSNVGDNSAYDSIRVTYSGYGTGSPECIFKPKTQPGTGIINTYFRFKTSGSAASGNIANVTVDGKVGIGTTNDVIASQLTVGHGDIEITKFATGLILRSNNGTRYRITVANDGTLTTTAV